MANLEQEDIQSIVNQQVSMRQAVLGLRSVTKLIAQGLAELVILASDVNEAQYKALVEALARENKTALRVRVFWGLDMVPWNLCQQITVPYPKPLFPQSTSTLKKSSAPGPVSPKSTKKEKSSKPDPAVSSPSKLSHLQLPARS